MKLAPITPQKALKAFAKQRPQADEIKEFKVNLLKLLGKVDEIEREENQKNHVRDFLRDTFYKESNEINTKDTKDLVVHLGKSNKDKVGVIIEAKRPKNTKEMLSAIAPNTRALHELILYYLRERIDENNIDIKFCVATNVYEWFIIDASHFEKHFFGNKSFVKEYEQWRDKQKVNTKTNLFYDEIAKAHIDKLVDVEIPCVYFNIKDYEVVLRNNDLEDDKKLIALYKILSPQHLLKIATPNDSNSLNTAFYKELLHIIGLEEAKDGGKSIIRRKAENRDSGSLLELTLEAIQSGEVLHHIVDQSSFGDTKEERLFNISLELCITWINRILFLKLLEGQLVTYHKGDKEFYFLNSNIVPDFDELFNLFHKVLAVSTNERSERFKTKYSRVPYLNSSLFDIEAGGLEDLTVKVSALDNHVALELISTTVLKDVKKKTNKLPTLNYLFQFLDAFDFSSDGSDDLVVDKKTIINASVLGKVFEKINGYKDGSIFTPAFITMYMCKQSIRLAVVQKFNEVKGWNVPSFHELCNEKIDRKEANQIINSLKICDPAVGSGHFLVSALNEIISIKKELNVLIDENGKTLKDYEIEIVNDELLITEDGYPFVYNPKNSKSNIIQKTLFQEKQTIIENCLFGVDINPNSVKICRLRLWIELLKNAYYKEETGYAELETLPNIDINIKNGNSLLSRFALDSDLKPILAKEKLNIESYKLAVHSYQNAKSKEHKSEFLGIINKIKTTFSASFVNTDPRRKRLSLLRGQMNLLENKKELGDLFEKLSDKDIKEGIGKLKKQIDNLEQEVDDVKNNTLYKNSFEWRFQFPEVLSNEGDFVGFDVVIGNPPYIQLQKDSGALAKTLENQHYKTFNKSGDIYMLFYEKGFQILKNNGFQSLITSSQWMKAGYGVSLRKYLLDFNNLSIISLGPSIFENATVDTNILTSQKAKNQSILEGSFVLSDEQFEGGDFEKIKMPYVNEQAWVIMEPLKQSIQEKLEKNGKKLSEWEVKIYRGILTGLNEAFIIDEVKRNEIIAKDAKSEEIIRPILRGREIKKYFTEWDGGYLISTFPFLKIDIEKYSGAKAYLKSFGKRIEQIGVEYVDENGNKVSSRKKTGNKWFETQDQIKFYKEFSNEKIIWKRIGSQLRFSYSDKEIFCLDSTCIATGEKIKYLTALLNSKLCQYQMFEKAPRTGMGDLIISVQALEPILVHYPSEATEKKITDLVDKILTAKKEGKDSSEYEKQIDELVYKLYEITPEERAIIEGQ